MDDILSRLTWSQYSSVGGYAGRRIASTEPPQRNPAKTLGEVPHRLSVILHATWNEAVNSRSRAPALERTALDAPASSDTAREAGASRAVCYEARASEQGHQSTPREV